MSNTNMTDPFVNPAATAARGLPVPRLTTQPAANPPIKLLPASDFPRVRTVTLLCCGWLGGVYVLYPEIRGGTCRDITHMHIQWDTVQIAPHTAHVHSTQHIAHSTSASCPHTYLPYTCCSCTLRAIRRTSCLVAPYSPSYAASNK
jgi:hypothetical protein